MARGPFAPEQPGEEDFLRQLIRARVQANPQILREARQLVGGNPEGAPPPTPQALTGLIRSETPLAVPPGPPVPSLTPRAPAGPAAGASMSGPMRDRGRVSSAGSSANAAAFDRGMQRAGLGPAQRAAGLGSAQQESTFDPNAWNKGERAGGMIQWRANRLSALQKFASQKGEKGFGSPETQGEFFGLEAQGKTRHLGSDESRGSRAFLAATTPEQASQALKSNIRWGHTGGRHEYSRAWGSKLPSAETSPPPSPAAAPGPRAEAPAPPSDGRVRVASTDPNFVPTPPTRPAEAPAVLMPPVRPDTMPQTAPLPPSRAEAFRTEQIGDPPPSSPQSAALRKAAIANPQVLHRYDPNAKPRAPTDPVEDLRKAAAANPQIQGDTGGVTLGAPGRGPSITSPLGPASAATGITVAETPATATAPATVTKVDPQTGGLRTYVVKGKDPGIVDRLNPQFSRALQTMIESAPPEVREHLRIGSAYRDPDHQARLYGEAVKKYGSEAAARKWVAPPGRSQHGHGQAVDLSYGSPEARQWAQANAANYGLRFPMAHEPWHIEAHGARDPNTKVLPPEAGGPAPGQPTPSPTVTQMPPEASEAPFRTDFTPEAPAADTAGSALGGLLSGLAKGLGGGSGGGNLNVETHISPGMGQGYDEKLGAMSKAALGAQPLFGNVGDLAKTRAMQKMFDLQDLSDIGQPQLARRKLGFGLG